MSDINSYITNNFSITRGGPFHWVLSRISPASYARHGVALRALGAVVLAWLPLLIFSVMQGLAYGTHLRISFLRDYAANVRFLFALPILILAETPADQRWRLLVQEFLTSRLVREKDLPAFEAVIGGITRLRNRVLPELILYLLALFPSLVSAQTELLMSGVSTWHLIGIDSGHPSLAGWWFNFVAMPIFRFLLLRWVWHMFLWTLFLRRVCKLELYLVATHSDLAAGLGFLAQGQEILSSVILAGGAVMASQLANDIAYEGATLSSLKFVMLAYSVMAVVLLVLPLLVVSPLLIRFKRKALLEFGALVTVHNQLFDAKWLRGQRAPDETILGNPDASSLIDLGSSFTVVQQMVPVPINKSTLITLTVAATLPMIAVVLMFTPTQDLIHAVLKILG